MKREMLKELGLIDDAIEKIMAENGRDVEKAKGSAEAKAQELATVRADLEEANKQISAFKGMDVEGIRAAAEEWKAKFEQSQAETAQREFDFALTGALSSTRARDPEILKSVLDRSRLTLKDGKVEGLEEQLSALRETKSFLFEPETPEHRVVAPTGGKAPEAPVTMLDAIAEHYNK